MDPEDVGCKDIWVVLSTGLTDHGPAPCKRVVMGRLKRENHRSCKQAADADSTRKTKESNKVIC